MDRFNPGSSETATDFTHSRGLRTVFLAKVIAVSRNRGYDKERAFPCRKARGELDREESEMTPGLLLCACLQAAPAEGRPLAVIQQAPDFTLTTQDNATLRLADLRGKV